MKNASDDNVPLHPILQKMVAEDLLSHDVAEEAVSYTHLTLPTIYSV